MIRKLIRQMLTAQILSALTVSLCLLIDSIVISRFLGERAIAAYGLANPLLLAIGAIGTLLSAGVQVVCSKALGRGSREEADEGYSTALAVAAIVSLVFAAAVIPLRSFLAGVMGAGENGEIHQMTSDYIAGFSIGAPGSMGSLVLVPFLQMAGRSGLLIAAVLTMTMTDVALDVLNVLVFHGGMFGMGLASALSYYAALAVGGTYLLSKNNVFRFSLKRIKKSMAFSLLRNGIPAGVNMLSSVILVYAMNQLLQSLNGSMALAAYTVIMSIGNAANCITTGVGGVSLTLCGIFFHEEDRHAMEETVQRLCRSGTVLGLGMGMILVAAAPAFVGTFIPEFGKTRDMAVLGLRLYAAGMIPCCICNTLKYAYQASERVGLTETISLAEGTVFPLISALLLSRFMETTGAWLGFAAGELLTLGAIALLIRKISGKVPWKEGAYLLLGKAFGEGPEESMRADIRTMEDVTNTAERAEAFCLEHGQDSRISTHIALCIEEMASNVIHYGFQEGKENHLSVLLLDKPGQWVLRFRDDCRAFDPMRYVSSENRDALGIRLVQSIARDVHYTYSMNLNNLTLKLPKNQGSGKNALEYKDEPK